LLTYAPHYQQLGWVLVGVKSPEGTPLELDLSQPTEQWSQQLADLEADQVQINIGIHTGMASNLLVLEVNQGEGALSLDQWGEWRSDCVAEMGECREQHYYTLPAESQIPPSYFLAPQVMIYGEGGLVLVPPSLEPQAREPWRWRRPPWEAPPPPPTPAVWQFLKEYIPAALVKQQVPPWPEIYRRIAFHGSMLKALLVPPASQEAYYQGILTTALGLGLKEPLFLVGLLWHAPQGEFRHNPDKWDYFQELVDQAQSGQEGKNSMKGLPARLEEKAWSDQPDTDPETASPAAQASRNMLEMLSGSGPTEAGLPEKEGSKALRFNQSVSGQFFQLLAGLGEKVIMESCRYDALLTGLSGKAGEIDNLVTQWEQHFAGASPIPGEQGQKPPGTTVEFAWDAVINQSTLKKQQIQEIQTAASDFLNQNPDLADDRHKVQMVIFCLRNYISINPDYAALPFREKLDRAGIMARGFFRMRGTA
jgi:hypothetical protein